MTGNVTNSKPCPTSLLDKSLSYHGEVIVELEALFRYTPFKVFISSSIAWSFRKGEHTWVIFLKQIQLFIFLNIILKFHVTQNVTISKPCPTSL